MARWLVLAAILAFAQSCAPRPWVAAARTGSLTDLQRYVEVAAERHQLGKARTRELAEVVAEREIATATDASAYDRVVGLAACASELYWPLVHRSKCADDGAAAAELVLLEAGLRDPDEASLSLINSASGAWRAVAARSAVFPERRSLVYTALVDPDRRVRRAAIRTIEVNPEVADARVLLEVARLDPETSLRQAALITLGEIGDWNSLLQARDSWDEMTESSRITFLQALSAPASRSRGSAQILTHIMESDASMAGVVAASLLRGKDSASSGYVQSRLLRALQQGTLSERLVALASLPSGEPEVQTELRKWVQSNEPYLRIAALESWAKSSKPFEDIRRRLQVVAASRDVDASEATRVLAVRGDESAILRLQRRLTAPDATQRLAAARLLQQVQRWEAVAKALTDDHPLVRLTTACNVLAR